MKYRDIKTDEQFWNCIHSKVKVEIWIGGVYEETTKINSYDFQTIEVDGGFYFRKNCNVITFNNYLIDISRQPRIFNDE